VFLASLLVLGLAACGGMKTYVADSRALDRQISIDGRSDDWVGALDNIPDAMVQVGFFNDQQNLYVSLVAENKPLRDAIKKSGLTVWFDPKGGDKKVLGIKYPLGMPTLARAKGSPDKGGTDQQAAPSDAASGEAGASLEIIHPDQESHQTRQKMAIADLKGVEIAASDESGLFVYELKIPLQSNDSHLFAMNTQAGKTIGIGFEVLKSSSGGTGNQSSDRMPGGGMPGGGGMGGGMGGRGGGMGGRGGMRGGSRGMASESAGELKIWTFVRLATAQVPSPAVLLYYY
jgi:hypothetical protein